MTDAGKAVFLSYASEDAEAARRIAGALQAAGIEVWLDQSELRGGDAWDRQIRERIHQCRLFIAVISSHTENRDEGYFRHEWNLAVERTHHMAENRAFIVPVAIDNTSERGASVPERFHDFQWVRLIGGETPPAFAARIAGLVGADARGKTQSGDATVSPRSISQSHPMSRRAGWRWLGITMAVIALLMGWAVWHYTHTPATRDQPVAPTVPLAAEKSIAVLPFLDMSETKDQEYFADGMAEEILDLLARVPDLRIPARTSSFYFKGKPTKVPEIARELGVANVLEGSVRRSGNRIRVTAQLIRADTGFHVWSDTYDRELRDVFEVQDDIANAVVQALQISLLGGPLSRTAGGTQNLEAYQLYLRAKAGGMRNTRVDAEAAMQYVDQAIKLDPNFALAWTLKATGTFQQTENGLLLPKDGYESARQSALHALQLSPDLSTAHLILAYVHRSYDWDWAACKAELRLAFESNQNEPLGLQLAGMLAYTLGKSDEAERQLEAALSRDPLNTYAQWNLGTARYLAGRYADAEAAYRRLLEIEPSFAWTHAYLAKTLLAEGKTEAAVAMARQEPEESSRLDILPIALFATGQTREADEALHILETKYGATDAFFVAMTYASRGDKDRALDWLERAYRQKDSSLVEIVGEPLFGNVATDPRYKAFLRKMNLPE